MSTKDFLGDVAAEASEDEEDFNPDGSPPGSPEGEGDDLQDSSDEDEGEEGDGEYDLTDKFIAADEEGGEGGSEDEGEADKKRKKKRRREALVLEEDDYDLLAENQVTGIKRPKKSERKRIRKGTDADRGDAEDGAPGRTAAEQIQEQLGFRNDGEGLEDFIEDDILAAPAVQEPAYDDEEDEDDEFRDFIVDDEPAGPGSGAAQPRRRIRRTGLPAGVSGAALREAQEIFGDVNGLLEAYAARRGAPTAASEDEDDDGLDEEAFQGDVDALTAHQDAQEAKKAARAERRARAQVDPALMQQHHMLPEDELLRVTDIPERLQLAQGRDLAQFDAAAAAEWVHATLWGRDALSSPEKHLVAEGLLEVDGPPPGRSTWRKGDLYGDIRVLGSHRALRRKRESNDRRQWFKDRDAQDRLKESIRQVVELVWVQHREVPLIAGYHKEAAGELLALRREDRPGWTSHEESRSRTDAQRPDVPEGAVQAKHRRIRRWDGLWAVYDASLRWRALQRRRQQREARFRESLQAAGEQDREALKGALESLQAATTLQEVADADAKHGLASAAVEASARLAELDLGGSGSGGGSRPRRAGGGGVAGYLAGKRAGLGALVAAFGISSSQVAQNLEAEFNEHDVEDPSLPPLEEAAQYVDQAAGFRDPEAVLARGRDMAAREVACEPVVRAFVRRVLAEHAVVSTDLTAAGEAKVDAFHEYGRVARLKDKPIDRLEGTDDFLRAIGAEKEGLITLQVGLKAADVSDLITSKLEGAFASAAVSDVATEWNGERRRVVTEVISRHLLPPLTAELRGQLATRAREVVARGVSDRLWQLASRAPLKVKCEGGGGEEEVGDRRVMAAVWGPGEHSHPPTTLVMLDSQGGLVDFLQCSQLSGLIPRPPKGHATEAGESGFYSIFIDKRKGQDAQRVKDFLMEHTPHVVAVGGGGLEARQLKTDLDAIRDSILETNARVMTGQETGNIDVQFLDENIAGVWADSAAAVEEMAEQPSHVRRAVGLGRCLLEQLPVVASLCGTGKEVLALELHPMQKALAQEDTLRLVEQTLVTVVNQVGVDINAAATLAWRSHTLPFVAGLGPRKARALLQAIKVRATNIERRHDILAMKILAQTCFINCSPFLRVRAFGSDMANAELDVLDDTRIQVTNYKKAINMASSAIENTGGEDMEAVEAAMQRPADLEALDLVAYADHLRRENPDRVVGQSVVMDIQMELLEPFMELRPEVQPLREEDIFMLLVGNQQMAVRVGAMVEARARGVTRGAVFCTLPDLQGLEAVVGAEHLSSTTDVLDCRDRVQPGAMLKARVLSVDVARFEVRLTTASAALADREGHWERTYCATNPDGTPDEYYEVVDRHAIAEQRRKEAARAAKKAFQPRPIRHVLYKNLSNSDTVEKLSKGHDGDCLFRPSPRGPHMLNLTIRLAQHPVPIYMHVDVKEGPKGEGMGAHLKLGRPLSVDVHGVDKPITFEDLDEVVASYVEPLVDNHRRLVAHPKYLPYKWAPDPGDTDEAASHTVQAQLRQQKAASNRAVYCFATRYELPGLFYLAHILRSSPGREMFSITPRGYYFRKRLHRRVDGIVNAFKQAPHRAEGAALDASDAQALGYQPPAYAAQTLRVPEEPSAMAPPPPPQQHSQPQDEGYGGWSAAAPAAPAVAMPSWQQRTELPPPPPPWAPQPEAPPPYSQQLQFQQPQYQQQPPAATYSAQPGGGAGSEYGQPQTQYSLDSQPPAQYTQQNQLPASAASAAASAAAIAARYQQQHMEQQAQQRDAGVPPPPPPPPQYAGH